MPLRLAPLQGGAAGMGSVLRIIPANRRGPGVRIGRPGLPTARSGWRLDGSAGPNDGGVWHGARTMELPGADQPLEAVVYGGDTWLTAQHLVVALHGGPADAWRLEFEPTLQRMAAEGLAVVAVNQRGSTGYGVQYAQALQDDWGGPDLDDVLAVLTGLTSQRTALGLEPASLFGVSYGAFLALLAACSAPEQVARCAVVAPFLSGARLLAEAGPAVQALTHRLGGAQEPADGRGARDVLRLCHRLAAPLLIVHGDQDQVVPVSQSRTLRQELLRMGCSEGTDFRYVEAAGAGHELLAEAGAPVLNELLAGFLRTGRPT
jgi:dipeptidyl aminopeptidase/acylaminoacyl peptidase